MIQTAAIAMLEDSDTLKQQIMPGSLLSQDRKRSLPLAAMQIQARVLDSVSDVELLQRFENPYQDPIEAVYTFPLPGAAAVYAFELKVGERLIKGEIQERAAARQAYQQALDTGHRAALMEQERDDVFTMQVGNLPAGESVEIRISFCQQLDFREQGLYELRLPTVVAPRYIPGSPKDTLETGTGVENDTEIVPDASRISPPRLAEGFDPKLDFQLRVELLLNEGQSISRLASSQHLVQTSFAQGKVVLELAKEAERLNRDFVLCWQSTAERLGHKLYTVQGPDASYGLLQLVAPASEAQLQTGRDVIFLLDRSGSMGDYKMASASQACSILLNSLGPKDQYAILAFDDRMDWMHPDSVWQNANEAGREKGQKFLQGVTSYGGTELFEAIQQSLAKVRERKDSANAPILVILTDGQVGDESRILKAIQKDLGEAVVYTIGIDTAVNDSFLTRLARLGGGTSVCVSPGEKLAQALTQIAQDIGYPALSELNLNLPNLAPDPLPDLYQGRSLSVFFKGELPSEPVLSAQSFVLGQAEAYRQYLKPEQVDFPALPRLWAKARIQALEDRFRIADYSEKEQLKADILALSLEHQVLCRFSAWLAVDASEVIAGHQDRQQIVQPVEMPESWDQSLVGGAVPPMPMMMQAMPSPMPPIAAAPMPMAPPPPQAPGGGSNIRQKMSSRTASFQMMNPPATRSESAKIQPAYEAEESLAFAEAVDEAPDLDFQASADTMQPKSTGLFGKLKEWVTGDKHEGSLPDLLSSEPTPQAAPAARAQAATQDSHLTHLIQSFLKLLGQVIEQLQKQQTVDTQALNQQREELIALLAESNQAENLPALQRLLRQESLRLLRALQAGSSQGLEALLQRCQQQLEQARRESPTGAFWEASI